MMGEIPTESCVKCKCLYDFVRYLTIFGIAPNCQNLIKIEFQMDKKDFRKFFHIFEKNTKL